MTAAKLRSYHILFVVRRRCPSIGSSLADLGLARLPGVAVLELTLGGDMNSCSNFKRRLIYTYISGWWFGTMEFYDFPFPFSWEFHDPN